MEFRFLPVEDPQTRGRPWVYVYKYSPTGLHSMIYSSFVLGSGLHKVTVSAPFIPAKAVHLDENGNLPKDLWDLQQAAEYLGVIPPDLNVWLHNECRLRMEACPMCQSADFVPKSVHAKDGQLHMPTRFVCLECGHDWQGVG
jgi:hypothetical protein